MEIKSNLKMQAYMIIAFLIFLAMGSLIGVAEYYIYNYIKHPHKTPLILEKFYNNISNSSNTTQIKITCNFINNTNGLYFTNPNLTNLHYYKCNINPQNIYLKFNIYNSQKISTPSPFQQLIEINRNEINNNSIWNCIISNPLNLIFYNSSNNKLYSWIEYISNNSILIWVKIPNEIPENSNYTLYMHLTNQNQYPYTGISPIVAQELNISPTQYDNGKDVFNYYQSFAGLNNTLPPGWTQIYQNYHPFRELLKQYSEETGYTGYNVYYNKKSIEQLLQYEEYVYGTYCESSFYNNPLAQRTFQNPQNYKLYCNELSESISEIKNYIKLSKAPTVKFEKYNTLILNIKNNDGITQTISQYLYDKIVDIAAILPHSNATFIGNIALGLGSADYTGDYFIEKSGGLSAGNNNYGIAFIHPNIENQDLDLYIGTHYVYNITYFYNNLSIYSIGIRNNSTSFYINYNKYILKCNYSTSIASLPITIGQQKNTNGPIYLYFVDIRNYPPNGVMPSVYLISKS